MLQDLDETTSCKILGRRVFIFHFQPETTFVNFECSFSQRNLLQMCSLLVFFFRSQTSH